MFGWLTSRLLEAYARRSNADIGYLLAIHEASPSGFRKFIKFGRLAAHCEVAPPEAQYAAMLVGMRIEDCGPCTQLVIDMARSAGVGDAQIAAVLTSDTDAMSNDTALAARFARAVAARSSDQDHARQAVRDRWGEKGVVDLTFALQANRLYPMIKAGLGVHVACQRVSVGSRTIEFGRQTA
jgi:hypothetical protein